MKRNINFNVNFDVAQIAGEVFSGIENLFSLPTLTKFIIIGMYFDLIFIYKNVHIENFVHN